MPYYIRKIRKSKWYKNSSALWLSDGELQADAIGDLITKGNKLSVWFIETDESNLDNIILALVTKFDNSSNLDFTLIEEASITKAGIKTQLSKGDTEYEEANNKWHYDLIELSSDRLFSLSTIIASNSDKIKRYREKKVLEIVKKFVDDGTIKSESIPESVKERFAILDSSS